MVNGFFSLKYIGYVTDTEVFQNGGLAEYHLLFSHPSEYFLDIFKNEYNYPHAYSDIFSTHQSYWNDLRDNLVIKLASIFDLFSFGNYYINVVFYNFVVFFGHLALFRVYANYFPNKKTVLIISCFLLPSLLFFANFIHKDGLILAAIGIIVFNIYQCYSTKISVWRILYILLAFLFIFLERNFVAIMLVPAIIAWLTAESKKYRTIIVFISVYILAALLFFNLHSFFNNINPPQIIVQRQMDYFNLPKAKSYLAIDSLEPTFKSFACIAPKALNHSLAHPYFSEIHLSKFILPFTIEIFIYGLLIIFLIIFNKAADYEVYWKLPFMLFGIFFSLSMFLTIGYTVPIIGSIIRYRSIYFPFLITPILCSINCKVFKKKI